MRTPPKARSAKPDRPRKRRAKRIGSAGSDAEHPSVLKWVPALALGFGLLPAVVLYWPKLFPMAPEKSVEVVWHHECPCATDWIESLRNDGFVVRDFEIDDFSTFRQQNNIPPGAGSCHPATFMGYFLDGHVPGSTLLRLAKVRPEASGVRTVEVSNPVTDGRPRTVRTQDWLIAGNGSSTPWP